MRLITSLCHCLLCCILLWRILCGGWYSVKSTLYRCWMRPDRNKRAAATHTSHTKKRPVPISNRFQIRWSVNANGRRLRDDRLVLGSSSRCHSEQSHSKTMRIAHTGVHGVGCLQNGVHVGPCGRTTCDAIVQNRKKLTHICSLLGSGLCRPRCANRKTPHIHSTRHDNSLRGNVCCAAGLRNSAYTIHTGTYIYIC